MKASKLLIVLALLGAGLLALVAAAAAAPPPEPAPQQYEWLKLVDGQPWLPGIQITVQTSDTIEVTEIVTSPLPFTLLENWDPAHLRLLDWAFSPGGMVITGTGFLEWHVPAGLPMPQVLTKWFHVEPCNWLETVLDEMLYVDVLPPEPRPVVILKLPPMLTIDALYDPPVWAGQTAGFTLVYANAGGLENAAMVRNVFPPSAPFLASIPPPDRWDPAGLWAEWDLSELPMGAQGNIDVEVSIQPGLAPSTTIEIRDAIYDHAGLRRDTVILTFHVEPYGVAWGKYVDGEPWYPDMHITRQFSDTIMVREVIDIYPPVPPHSPFAPAPTRGPAAAGAPPATRSPAAAPAAPRPTADPDVVLWDQPLSAANQNAYVDQEFPDLATYSSFLADDFWNAQAWDIDTILIPGGLWNGATDLHNAVALTWQIYGDDLGIPAGDPSGGGQPPLWTLTLPPNDPLVTIDTGSGGLPSDTYLNLPVPLGLPPGHWWLVFFPTADFATFGQYGRQPADTANGYVAQFINPGGGFGLGTAWQPWGVLGVAQADLAFRLEGEVAVPPNVVQIETWDPARLTLLDWAATGGEVIVEPGRVVWTEPIATRTTITLTKWFRVEPCAWAETLLWEELWIGDQEVEQRPVRVLKLPAALRIDADYPPQVEPGQALSFTLFYGNDGGREPGVWVRNVFPLEAPFVASLPPPALVDPAGLWAEWDVGLLPMGAGGSIEVGIAVTTTVQPGAWITVTDWILDHLGQPMDRVDIRMHVVEEVRYGVYLPIVLRGYGP